MFVNQGEGAGKECDTQGHKISESPGLKEGGAQHKKEKKEEKRVTNLSPCMLSIRWGESTVRSCPSEKGFEGSLCLQTFLWRRTETESDTLAHCWSLKWLQGGGGGRWYAEWVYGRMRAEIERLSFQSLQSVLLAPITRLKDTVLGTVTCMVKSQRTLAPI